MVAGQSRAVVQNSSEISGFGLRGIGSGQRLARLA
jgi:hypothetical protein